MLEFCGRKFTCDECPICEGVEHRLRAAREGGYEPQLECTSVEGFRETTDAESGYKQCCGRW